MSNEHTTPLSYLLGTEIRVQALYGMESDRDVDAGEVLWHAIVIDIEQGGEMFSPEYSGDGWTPEDALGTAVNKALAGRKESRT